MILTMPVLDERPEQAQQTGEGSQRELRRCLESLSKIRMSRKECESLAAAALDGCAEAQFLVGSVLEAAGDPTGARHWYHLAAAGDYLPAMLQLCAV